MTHAQALGHGLLLTMVLLAFAPGVRADTGSDASTAHQPTSSRAVAVLPADVGPRTPPELLLIREDLRELQARRKAHRYAGPILTLSVGVMVGAPVAFELVLWGLAVGLRQMTFESHPGMPFPFRRDVALRLGGVSAAFLVAGGSWLAVTIVRRAKYSHQIRVLKRKERELEVRAVPLATRDSVGLVLTFATR